MPRVREKSGQSILSGSWNCQRLKSRQSWFWCSAFPRIINLKRNVRHDWLVVFAGDIEPSLQGCPGEPQPQLGTVRPIVVDIRAVTDANPNVTVVAEYEQGQYEGKTCTLSVYFKNFWGSFVDHWITCFGLLLMSALGFKARMDPITCVLRHLHAMESSNSPLVRHHLTSWRPAAMYTLRIWGLSPVYYKFQLVQQNLLYKAIYFLWAWS